SNSLKGVKECTSLSPFLALARAAVVWPCMAGELAGKQRSMVLSDSSYGQRKKKYPPWEKLQVAVHTRIAHSE
ncbi:MAG TPA: hypothetical protein DEF11_05400, partial [Shigella sp.]|nr:hypothetical protein [Shigella sp.]